MSVTSVCFAKDGWSGNGSIPFQQSYTARWVVTVNDPDDGPATIANPSTGAPAGSPDPAPELGDSYSVRNDTVANLFANNITITPDQRDALTWNYDVTFEQRQRNNIPGDELANPLSRPVRRWLEWEHITRLADVDTSGVPIANSAGIPFDPPAEIDDALMVMVFQKNLATFDTLISDSISYKFKTNTATFHGQAAGTCLMRPWSFSPQIWQEGQEFFEVQIRVLVDPNGFQLKPVDLGSVVVEAGNLKQAADEDFAFSERLKLNGIDGTPLDPQTTAGVLLDGGGGRKGPFTVRGSIDYSPLSL